MKKFSLLIIAALVAVTSWAQFPSSKVKRELPEQAIAKTAATMKMAPEKKEMAPRQALKGTVQAPAQKFMKKAPAKVKKAIDLTSLLTGDSVTFMVLSNAFAMENAGTEEEPDYQLVSAELATLVEQWTMKLDAATMAVSITGINGGETPVTGTVDITNKTITIPYGQPVGTTSYGTIGLASATGAENLVCTLDGDVVVFEDLWYIQLIDGDYAGYMWSDIYSSLAVLPNGTMTWNNSNGEEAEAPLFIDFDAEKFVATVWNFGDEGVAIDVNLKSGGKFVIESQLVYVGGSTYGNFYTYDADCETPTITGTGTENTLTFASEWTCYAPTSGYWFGKQGAATITFDGTFTYPELVEAPATPADPSVLAFAPWDDELGYATVTVNIPSVDVDGNDIIASKLSYQLFTKNEGDEPVALGEPIAYDAEGNGAGDKKTVKLGEEAKGLTVIGVKSSYTALEETNESQTAWFDIPQPITIPEGLELTEYPVSADARYNTGWDTYVGTVNVGIDGTDFYIQGLFPYLPKAWAKGTIEGNTVTIPSLQFLGAYNGSFIYLTGAAIQSNTVYATDITFTYNADENVYISEDLIVGNIGSEDVGSSVMLPYYDGIIIGTVTVPELVELPEGAEVVEYPFVGNIYDDGAKEFESTVNVAVVENDVYVQGINGYAPEVWVKGTKDEEGNVVFPTGQNLGLVEEEDYYGETTSTQYFLVGANASTGQIEDVVMTYNAEEDYYKLQNEMLVNAKKLSINYDTWYIHGTTIGYQKTIDVTFDFRTMDVPTSTDVTTDGDILEDTVIVRSNVALTITPAAEGVKTPNRFWNYKKAPQLRMYSNTLTFTTTDGTPITKIDFSENSKWNAENSADSGEFEGTVWTGKAETVVVTIAGNSQMSAINVTTEAKLLPPLIETVAPEDLESSDWKIEATEIVYVEPEAEEDDDTYEARKEGETEGEEEEGTFEPVAYTTTVQVGFYTVEGEEGTDVYIQGLCPELPEAWVKAPLVDGKVTIPSSTYFGENQYIDWDLWAVVTDQMFLTSAEIHEDGTYSLADVVFNYDAEADKLTSDQPIFVNADRRTLSFYHWYEGMTITKLADVAATPADPEIPEDGLQTVDVMYPKIKPIIKTVDVEGNDLLTSKLAYTIWVEKDGMEEQLTFTTDLYTELEEDMTEIPYNFGDGWDIYAQAETIYFNQSAEEIASWSKVGVQSIYYGGGERKTSNIVWADNLAYDPEIVGISDMKAENGKAVIFDLQGRRVAKAAKGLYIQNGKKVVIK